MSTSKGRSRPSHRSRAPSSPRTQPANNARNGDLFSPIQNAGAFSGHWLEHRLGLEPEWEECAQAASDALALVEQLWKQEHDRVARYGDEQGLEQAFIQPVLKALGWRLKYQTLLQGRKPDYALFVSDADLDAALVAGRKEPEFWASAAAVADAKQWDLSLDKKFNASGKKEYPPEQMEWYLDRSRKPFGILTNGRVWRLIPRELSPHQRRFQTYYQVDLVSILNEVASDGTINYGAAEDFRRFFLLFGAAGFAERDGRKPLFQRAVEGSSEYRVGVSEGLKEKAFEALRICIEGFLAWKGNKLKPQDLAVCRESGFILLCRLLFIMFAEDRRLLPYKVNSTYTKTVSLGKLRDEIAAQLDKEAGGRDPNYTRREANLWDDVHALFSLIDMGGPRYGIHPYNGGLFDPTSHQFLDEMKMPDWHLARVIDSLSRAPDPEHPDRGLFRVDYRDLALQHLGGIYEGLLELHPALATERMLVYTRRHKGVIEELCVPESDPHPEGFAKTDEEYGPGSVYLIKDKAERRAFGSYYTPDHIVDYIVRQTVGPLCDAITTGLEKEIAAAERRGEASALAPLHADFPNRALKLRIVDPAMGSGHFLLSACQQLAEQIATNPYTPTDPDNEEGASGDDALAYWKRQVVENCLYGVDVNPLAVDLAKLALWLETVMRNRPLSFLDHHLKHGDSLLGARLRRMGALHDAQGWVAEAFESAFQQKLPALLGPLAEIRDSPSNSRDAMKKKTARFDAYRQAVEPFWLLAGLWTADTVGSHVDVGHYSEAVASVDKPSKFKTLAQQDWFRDSTAFAGRAHAFHWDLAFPEVFCAAGAGQAGGGFDAVVGNPPYEVLSEKESGIDPGHLKTFIGNEPLYAPAERGKQNLYKLFICRSLDLLRDGGRFGFIVPMALLGDDQSADMRRHMAKLGEFASVDAFPQKDKPKQRVFADAKLSTTVFSFVKTLRKVGCRPFRSRLWGMNVLDGKALGELVLTTDDIQLYDPANFTIASCGQADWDLAVRIMKSGRMVRLKGQAEFFQGEVNETNERANGTLVGKGQGQLVTRGACICLYTTRAASQGEDLYLDVDAFTEGKAENTKAFHHRHRRIGWQESSPQNNFRRIIAAMIPTGEFCNHKINYCPEHTSKLPLSFVLGLLNSLLSDWYFRLGSTNAAVSHYQIHNLPCPVFRAKPAAEETAIGRKVTEHLGAGRSNQALSLLAPLLADAPFSPVVQGAVVAAVNRIIDLESKRGGISRTERSALSEVAQPFQDFIDSLFFEMAGLTSEEVAGLKARYERMKNVK